MVVLRLPSRDWLWWLCYPAGYPAGIGCGCVEVTQQGLAVVVLQADPEQGLAGGGLHQGLLPESSLERASWRPGYRNARYPVCVCVGGGGGGG